MRNHEDRKGGTRNDDGRGQSARDPNGSMRGAMNKSDSADACEGVDLRPPEQTAHGASAGRRAEARDDSHWQWRMGIVRRIAAELDAERYGVAAMYVFGSTKDATAGPASDIDLIIHFRGSPEQREALENWLSDWDQKLIEMNASRTGCSVERLLDPHIVTDADVEKGTSFAARIVSVDDPAQKVPLDPRE